MKTAHGRNNFVIVKVQGLSPCYFRKVPKAKTENLIQSYWIHQSWLTLSLPFREWGNFGFVPCQFLELACQFCFSNNGQAAYNSEFILTLGFNSILWSFYNSQWLKKETYTKFCKKWLKRNIANNGRHDIVKL